MNVIFKEHCFYDDPVGNWYKCDNCNEEVFIPSGYPVYSYCPYCGEEIDLIDGNGQCKDDDNICIANFIQIKNPRTQKFIKIDKKHGRIVASSKNEFLNVELIK